MAQSQTERQLSEKELFDRLEVGKEEDAGTLLFTQEEVYKNREALDWPNAAYPVLHAPRHDVTPDRLLFRSRVNARQIRQFFNPPIPGKKIHLTMRVTEKYYRGDVPYLVEEVKAVDEDGRHIETMTVHQLLRTSRVGEKANEGR